MHPSVYLGNFVHQESSSLSSSWRNHLHVLGIMSEGSPANPSRNPALDHLKHGSTPLQPSKCTDSSDHLTKKRALDLLENCLRYDKIFAEIPTSCDGRSEIRMLDYLLERTEHFAPDSARSLLDLPELDAFMTLTDRGTSSEVLFSDLLREVCHAFQYNVNEKIGLSATRSPHVAFITSGSNPFNAWQEENSWAGKEQSTASDTDTPTPNTHKRNHGLKPDFFSSRVQMVAKDRWPLSLDPQSQLEVERIRKMQRHSPRENLPSCEVIQSVNQRFKWEDVRDAWELKSKSTEINSKEVLGNLILKSTHILRYQWHRRFVNGLSLLELVYALFYSAAKAYSWAV